MDQYHCYREVLKGSFTMAFLSLLVICFVLSQGWSYGVVLASFAAMGLFTLPVLPGVIENAVEATYPIPEEASSGLLFCSGNVLGIAFTEILAQLVKKNKSDDDDDDDDNSGSGDDGDDDDSKDGSRAFFTQSSVFLLGTIALCVMLVLPYNGEYKRLAAEKKLGSSSNPPSSSSSIGGSSRPDALHSPLLAGGADNDDYADSHPHTYGVRGRGVPPEPPSPTPPSEVDSVSHHVDLEV